MSAHALSDLLQGQKAQMEIGALASALRELWQQAAPPVERRCELNLVVLLSDVHLAEQVLEAVAEFSQLHPNRALIVFAEPDAPEAEETAYLALQTLPGAQIVCGEQITLRARGAQAVQDLPQNLWPLLVAVQPILFWSVQGLPESSSLIERLQRTSAKLVFDSALAPELGITLARAHELQEDWAAGVLDDMNWLRLAPWREILAQALAEAGFQEQGNAIQRVSLTFGGGVLDEARLGQPALLLSWLASRLGWNLTESLSYSQNAFHALWEQDGREIACEIQTNDESQPEIVAVELHAQPPEGKKVLSLGKVSQQETAMLQSRLLSEGPQGGQTRVLGQKNLAATSLAQLLAQAYAQKTHEAEYDQALRLATKLV